MNLEDIKEIAVIGSGDMGHGIAEVAILSDYKVIMNDIKQEFLDNARERITKSLETLARKNKITEERMNNSLTNLSEKLELEEAVKNANLVIEAVPELLSLKKEIFQKTDAVLAKNGIIATNTSNMSITELAKVTNRPDRIVGLHFFNPAIIMKLVEVIKGEKTSEETMDLMVQFVKKIDKIPVKVLKDSPGFIVNRVTAPVNILLGKIIDSNIEEPGRVDASVKAMGMPMGPFELADYVGLDVMLHSMEYFKETLSPDYEIPKWLKQKVEKKELGKKTRKGIYDWSKGRPDLSSFKPSKIFQIEDLMAVQVNEATKLVEEGVVENPRQIDKAIKNGTGNKAGVISLAKSFGLDKMAKNCEKLAEKFNVKTFKPTKLLSEGKI